MRHSLNTTVPRKDGKQFEQQTGVRCVVFFFFHAGFLTVPFIQAASFFVLFSFFSVLLRFWVEIVHYLWKEEFGGFGAPKYISFFSLSFQWTV